MLSAEAQSRPSVTPLSRDLAAWMALFQKEEIPVLAATAEALEAVRANEDDIDARAIGELTSADPLMTLKVLVYAAAHRSAALTADVQSVTAAVMLMGTSPFFNAFGAQPTVEARLDGHPEALAGLHQVVRRSHRSARFALAFAVHRNDHDAALIHQAALLHDFAEMLLYCHAPLAAVEVVELQRRDATLRSRAAQQHVLGAELQTVQQQLMLAWKLPSLLTRIAGDRDALHAGAMSVALGVRIARHSSGSWCNPALPDDVTAAASLLNLSESAVLGLLHEIDF